MKIEENIEKLIEVTKAGKIKWNKKNPTTFNWLTNSSDGEAVNTIVQKIGSSEEPEIIFRLWNMRKQYAYIDMKYTESPEDIKQLLKTLYETVSGNNLFNDDILSDLLKDF